MRKLTYISAFFASLFLAACGGGGGGGSTAPTNTGSSGGGTVGGSTADYAPNTLPSGSSMSMNPTLTFNSATTLAYANAGDSAFADSLSSATWSYTPYTNGPTTGTLTVAGDGGALSSKHFSGPTGRTAVLLTFQFANHAITGATATVNGSTYAVTFTGTPLTPGSGPATGATAPAHVIPGNYEGTWTLNYNALATGGDFSAGQKVGFQVSADTLTFAGKSLAGPAGIQTTSAGMSGPPWDFADAGTGVTYRYSPYSASATTPDPSVSVIKAGAILGIFSAQTPTTAPAGTPPPPLLNKVHTMVCTYNDDPNKAATIGTQATFKFTDTNPAGAAYLLNSVNAVIFQDGAGLKSNADGTTWTSTPSGSSGDVTYDGVITVTVDVSRQLATDYSETITYKRNGATFRVGTLKLHTLYAN